ncbi:MAG: RNA-directed DNA polymerase [Planctomycetota bacterium]|nr:MAG: RNA-directed DNA polymerase [Planctomycetota bacterium]
MRAQIQCPNCSQKHHIQNPYPGSLLLCPHCQTALLLELSPELEKEFHLHPPKQYRFTIHSGRKKQPLTPTILPPETLQQLQEKALFALSRWLDLNKEHLSNVLQLLEQNQAYDEFKIPKTQPHTFRQISAPKEELKLVQRRILDRLLYRIPTSNACHGFTQGRSIVTNAKFHLPTAYEIYNLDLKDAFPTVNTLWVKHLLVRYLKIPLKHLGEHVEHEVLDEIILILTKMLTHKNGLPQGSPASGCLLNIACIKMDKYLYKLIADKYQNTIRYSRYADDLTFSSPTTIPQSFRQEVQQIIRNCGFSINPSKIKYLSKKRQQLLEVTGLILEKGQIRIPKTNLERYRATIHNAYLLPHEELTEQKRLEVHSIVAFVSMVYSHLPNRIQKPYQKFLEKHGGKPIGKLTKLGWKTYPPDPPNPKLT